MPIERRRPLAAALVLALMVAVAGKPAAAAEPPPPEGPAEDPSDPSEDPSEARRPGWYTIPAKDPRRVSLVGHVEAQLIGLAVGLRTEALYRPFRADRGVNLVLGVGLEGGPELFYLPVSLGWRQQFVPHRILTLELGAGYEQQSFFVPGLAPITRPAIYAEGGLSFRVIEHGWLGAQVAASWAPILPGAGLAVRLGFRWDFGRRSAAR